MRQRGIVIAAAIAAVVVAFVLSSGRDGRDGGQGARPAGDAVRISFVYSPEKEKLLKPLIREFNAQDGRAFVEG